MKALLDLDLGRLEVIWDEGVEQAYRDYLALTVRLGSDHGPTIATAAALVEEALRLQGLASSKPAEAAAILLADLCLSKASRLLVDAGSRRLQVGFARAVEGVAAAAAAGRSLPDVRAELSQVIEADG